MRTAPENGGVPIASTYQGGTAYACGTSATATSIPSGSTWAIIAAEGAAVYYKINGTGTATTVSPGYVPSEGQAWIPALDNLGTLSVVGAGTAAVAHISFFAG